MNPREPIYIPSYNRWQDGRRKTIKLLEKCGIPYHVIVEPKEESKYQEKINPELGEVLVLPESYKEDYHKYLDLDEGESVGSGPARNFGWEHAKQNGHDWYWCVDDNIRNWFRHHENQRIHITDGSVLRLIEDFTKHYENIAMAGPHYSFFFPDRSSKPAIVFNTRIYSCNLIRTDLPYRWQGKYNEDTDLSLRMLKDGWCTACFNALLADKEATQSSSGGNTERVYGDKSEYDEAGTYEKTKALKEQHPTVVSIESKTNAIQKHNRWHHDIDYSPFKSNELQRKEKSDCPTIDYKFITKSRP
jgi:hypothetical protein